jgi:hypothetical protein
VKIIVPGFIRKGIYEAECRNCKCVFEFTQEDGEVVRDWRDGDFIKVECPTCKASIAKSL